MQLFDDFIELKPGAVSALERELREQNKENQVQRLSQAARGVGNLFSQTLTTLSTWSSQFNKTTSLLPNSNMLNSTQAGNQAQSNPYHLNQPGNQNILHLMLCVDKGLSGAPLFQERLADITTDRQLFMFLRSEYAKKWHPGFWLTLRTIETLSLTRVSYTIGSDRVDELADPTSLVQRRSERIH